MAGKDNDVGADIRMSALLVSALVKASNDELGTFLTKRQSLDVDVHQIRQVRDLIRELCALLKDGDDARWGDVDDAYGAIVGDRGDEPAVSSAGVVANAPEDAVAFEPPIRAEHPEIQRPPALGELLGASEPMAPSVRAFSPSPWVEPSRALQAKARAAQPLINTPSEPVFPARVPAPSLDPLDELRHQAEAAAVSEPRTGTMVPPPPDSVRPDPNGPQGVPAPVASRNHDAAPLVGEALRVEPSALGDRAASDAGAANRTSNDAAGVDRASIDAGLIDQPAIARDAVDPRRQARSSEPEPGGAVHAHPVDRTTIDGVAADDALSDVPARVGSGTEPPPDEAVLDDDLDATEERARSSTLPPMAMNDEALPFPSALPHAEAPTGRALPPEALANVIAGLPPMTVVSYAALAASGDAFPQRIAETHAKFGVTNGHARQALDAVWRAKLDGDPRLRALWATLHEQFTSWLSFLQ